MVAAESQSSTYHTPTCHKDASEHAAPIATGRGEGWVGGDALAGTEAEAEAEFIERDRKEGGGRAALGAPDGLLSALSVFLSRCVCMCGCVVYVLSVFVFLSAY